MNRDDSGPILAVEGLETTFFTKRGALKALDGVSYEIGKGETVGVVGESGCGKSVTSLSIMGLLQPPGKVTGGKVLFQGMDLVKTSESALEDLRGNRMAMIFQEPMTALNPVLTVGFQIDEQVLRHWKVTRAEAKDRSIEMLRLVGIPSPEKRYGSYIHQLSGGMRQRAMIAMALSCEPTLLIADEPTTALDVTIQGQVIELIQGLQESLGMAVQFITHDLGVISEIADRVVVMYAGQVCEVATTEELFGAPSHPYTRLLLASLPKRGARKGELQTIEGTVPSLLERPKGCPFQNRCPQAKPECGAERPPVVTVKPGHLVACHLAV